MLIRCIFEYFQKKRKVLTMNKKMEILTNLENGMKNWEIYQKYNVSNSSALHSVVVGEEGSSARYREACRARKREVLLQGISSFCGFVHGFMGKQLLDFSPRSCAVTFQPDVD